MSTITLTMTAGSVALVDGRASVTATVTNNASAPARITVGAFPVPSTPPDPGAAGAVEWTSVEDPVRTIPAGGTEQFTITFAPPAGASPGGYRVRFIAYSADGAPEENADQAHQLEFLVPGARGGAVPTPKPWWPWAVAAALLLVTGVVASLVLRPDGRPPEPQPTLTTVTPTPTPTPPPPPEYLTSSVVVTGTVFLNDVEDFSPDENRTVQVQDTVELKAGTPASYSWTSCVGGEVQGYLDVNLTLDRHTGNVAVSGWTRYYEGTRCGMTNLRRNQEITVTVEREQSVNFRQELKDGNGALRFNLVLTNHPATSG